MNGDATICKKSRSCYHPQVSGLWTVLPKSLWVFCIMSHVSSQHQCVVKMVLWNSTLHRYISLANSAKPHLIQDNTPVRNTILDIKLEPLLGQLFYIVHRWLSNCPTISSTLERPWEMQVYDPKLLITTQIWCSYRSRKYFTACNIQVISKSLQLISLQRMRNKMWNL